MEGDRRSCWVSPVLRPPALDEAHAYGAHPGELVHGFKALIDRLGEKSGELLVVEYLQVTSWRETGSHTTRLSTFAATGVSCWVYSHPLLRPRARPGSHFLLCSDFGFYYFSACF